MSDAARFVSGSPADASLRRVEAFRSAAGGRAGALLVHGFTGSPYEMRPLAEPLERAGFDVLGVRLPGHGARKPGEPNEAPAWRAAVEAGLAELAAAAAPAGGPRAESGVLRADGADRHTDAGVPHAGGARDDRVAPAAAHRPIAVIGLSMGALLALDLAAREPDRVHAVVALSPALALPLGRRVILWLAARLAPAALRARPMSKGESDIRDAAARAAHPVAPPFPLAAALSFDELRRAVRARVGEVRQPLLIVHSRLDRTCPLAGARWLARHAGSRRVELHGLERSGHVIPVDLEHEAAARLVVGFLGRTLAVPVHDAAGAG